MFIGHLAVAFAAKTASPRTSLGTLLLAAQLPDLLWPAFLLLGFEHAAIVPGETAVTPIVFLDYPLSHSLLADVGWGLVLAGLYTLLRKNSLGAFWLWLLVVSHWVLDAISHRADMPISPASRLLIGFGLWNSRAGTLGVEITLFAVAVALYSGITRPRDKTGSTSLLVFVFLVTILYLASVFGPPPPSIRAVALSDLGGWLLVAWSYWIDRHRLSVPFSFPQDQG